MKQAAFDAHDVGIQTRNFEFVEARFTMGFKSYLSQQGKLNRGVADE